MYSEEEEGAVTASGKEITKKTIINKSDGDTIYDENLMNCRQNEKKIDDLHDKIIEMLEEIKMLEERIKKSEELIQQAVPLDPLFEKEIRNELALHAKEVAVVKEWVRLFEDNVRREFREVAEDNKEIKELLKEHIDDETKTTQKMMIGVISSGASSIATLIFIIWGFMEFLNLMRQTSGH